MELEFLSLLWSSESREAGQFARFRVVTPKLSLRSLSECSAEKFGKPGVRVWCVA